MSLIPGPKRVNLHALYLEADTAVERNEIEPRHFANWVDWAKKPYRTRFNPSYFPIHSVAKRR